MDDEIFKEEEKKLKKTIKDLDDEEQSLEKTLSTSNMQYNVEDQAKGLRI